MELFSPRSDDHFLIMILVIPYGDVRPHFYLFSYFISDLGLAKSDFTLIRLGHLD